MMSVKILELLDFIGKNIRGNEKPFGGIQLLFSGDFYQLPPIENDSFCFESPLWNKIFKKENQIEFKTIFRQKDDTFQNILNEIRVGTLTKENEIILKRYLNRNHKEVKPAKLYPLRYKVDNMNNTLYNNLESKEYIYPMIKNINTKKYLHNNTAIPSSILEKCNRLSKEQIEKEIQNLMITNQIMDELKIKEGSIIMCTSNLDVENGICNGSQGVVEDCSATLEGPTVRFYNGKKIKLNLHYIQSDDYPIISIGYYPICYAWAMTIHKIQGTTLDCAEIDIGNNVFTYGQSYVALSRLKSLDGLYLKEISKEKITVHPKVKEFYSNLTL
jgi:ATP-dependent DNA helicase PIF1